VKLVFIAGPYTAPTAWDIEQNIRNAESVAYKIAMGGGMPVCPHSNTRFFHGLLTPEFWYEGTLSLLRRCDAVMMFGMWRESKGARLEYDEARRLNLCVFDKISYIEQWLKNSTYIFEIDP
jgi:hypothetical protein